MLPPEQRKTSLDDYVREYYRAFLEPVPERRYKGALDLINPPRDQRNECEAKLIFWIRGVEFAVDFKSTPVKVLKSQFALTAKKLRAAALAAGDPDLQKRAVAYATVGDAIPRKPRSKGNAARLAVWAARELLEEFGDPPTLTREGKWHQLSCIVYDERRRADLFHVMRSLHDEASLGQSLFGLD